MCSVDKYGARYCCLGVLYEVEDGPDAWVGVGNYCLTTSEGDHTVYLPKEERETFPVYTFVDMSDFQRKTFAEIADWIEENL